MGKVLSTADFSSTIARMRFAIVCLMVGITVGLVASSSSEEVSGVVDSPNVGDNTHDLDSSVGKACVKCVKGVVHCIKKCHDADHKAKCTTKCVALRLPKCAMCVPAILKCFENVVKIPSASQNVLLEI